MENFASGHFGGIGGITVAHVVQADNTAAMTLDTVAADHSGWHWQTEAWLTIRPAVSQVLRRIADAIWDHAVPWWTAVAGWSGWHWLHEWTSGVWQKLIAVFLWLFSDHG